MPGDKSISHRSLMLASVAVGESTICGLLESEDVLNTAKAMAALGTQVERWNDGTWHVHGNGIAGLQQPEQPIDFGNAGTGARLCMGLVASSPLSVEFCGDASLSGRPMGRIMRPLEQMGCRFDASKGDRLPLTLHGAHMPAPIRYRLPVASAQIKSAILLAGLNTPGKTTVIEPEATRDHTERMLSAFGSPVDISVIDGARHISVTGHRELTATRVIVPGDPSSAAFPLAAGLICKGSAVTVENMLLNPSRVGLLDTLLEMGADISVSDRKQSGGEDIGTVTASFSALKGVQVPADRAPSMIDEYPVLAVIAASASGTTRMEGLGELRVKESDRLAVVATGLEANGVSVRTGDDWMEVDGGPVPGGGLVVTHLDHRIAMAFLVLGLSADNPVTVDDGSVIETSFPGFIELVQELGGNIGHEGKVS